MPKFYLKSNTGSINDTKSIGFEVVNLTGKSRVSFENITYGKFAEVSKIGKYVETNESKISGNLDLNVGDSVESVLVTVFCHIENENNGKYELTNILSSSFWITDEFKSFDRFDGKLLFDSNFFSKTSNRKAIVSYKPNSEVVVEFNKNRFSLLTNDSGDGSLSFDSYRFNFKDSKVIQKYPVYIYTDDDNYISPKFSGQFIDFLPAKISMYQDCTDWSIPQSCLNSEAQPVVTDSVEYITQSPTYLNIDTTDCSSEAESVEQTSVRRINSIDSCILPNGQIACAYSGQLSTETNDDLKSLHKVFLTTINSTVEDPIIGTLGSGDYGSGLFNAFTVGIVVPSITDGQIDLVVTKKAYDTLAVGGFIILFDEPFNGAKLEIIEKKENDDRFSVVLSTGIIIETILYCVQYMYLPDCDSPSELSFTIPYISISDTEFVSAINPAIAASPYVDITSLSSYIYIIAEGVVSGVKQLFLYSIKYQINPGCQTSSIDNSTFGWVQLTYRGENKNPKVKADGIGNLHIIWESDRLGSTQLYYGVLGPSGKSLSNASLSTILDKQSELILLDKKPHEYVDINLYSLDSSMLYFDPAYMSFYWTRFTNNSGSVTVSANQDITVSGNPVKDMSLGFVTLNDGNGFSFNDGLYSQLNYQIDFDLTSVHDSLVLDDTWLNDAFNDFKAGYTATVDSGFNHTQIYTDSDNNKFVIGKKEKFYDRIIPIVGSYKNPYARQLEDDQNTTSNQAFRSVVQGSNATVRHFILALMPEKTNFKATNIQSLQEFADENLLSLSAAQAIYTVEDSELYYTGRYKFAILLNSDSFIGKRKNKKHTVVRRFSDPIDFISSKNIKVVCYYDKLNYEDASSLLGKNVLSHQFSDFCANFSKFVCSINVLVEDKIVFSESFVTDFSDQYRSFDIGFGFTAGGHHSTNELLPYESNIFDNLNCEFNFNNITIGRPTIVINNEYITIPDQYRNPVDISVADSVPESNSLSYFKDSDLLGFGFEESNMELIRDEFPQIPLTLSGINKSPSLALGMGGDLHVAYESNRNKYWNIYYFSSINRQSPFRYETQITDSNSTSIYPNISVGNNGKRLIVWHDNRNGNYQIYAAKSQGNSFELENVPEVIDKDICEDLIELPDLPPIDLCELEFTFCFDGCCLVDFECPPGYTNTT